MSLTLWLESKVKQLECEIRSSDVFESDGASSREQVVELKKRIVLHRYLAQALERRRAADRSRRTSGEFALASLVG